MLPSRGLRSALFVVVRGLVALSLKARFPLLPLLILRRVRRLLCSILTIEKLGDIFNQTTFPLRYTPRKMITHPASGQLVIIESDHNAYTYKDKKAFKAAVSEVEKDGDGDAVGSIGLRLALND